MDAEQKQHAEELQNWKSEAKSAQNKVICLFPVAVSEFRMLEMHLKASLATFTSSQMIQRCHGIDMVLFWDFHRKKPK